MARDYAKPAPPPNKKRPVRNQRVPQRPPTPAWAVFAGGVGAGLAVALAGLLLWWSNAGEEPDAALTADAKAAIEDDGETKPRFDFYTLLKESEVFVPETGEPVPTATPEKPAAEQAVQDKTIQDKAAQDKAKTADKSSSPPPPPPAAVQPPQGYEFVLQVGSFRSRSEADEMRARLLLLGLKAGLDSASGRPGEVWHRVMIGPFDSPAALAQARARLQANGIDHIPVKRKQP